jgi:hypothetical protein
MQFPRAVASATSVLLVATRNAGTVAGAAAIVLVVAITVLAFLGTPPTIEWGSFRLTWPNRRRRKDRR